MLGGTQKLLHRVSATHLLDEFSMGAMWNIVPSSIKNWRIAIWEGQGKRELLFRVRSSQGGAQLSVPSSARLARHSLAELSLQ